MLAWIANLDYAAGGVPYSHGTLTTKMMLMGIGNLLWRLW